MTSTNGACGHTHTNGTNTGPGHATPQDAIAAPPETLLYLPAVVADDSGRPDYLVTVDVDPTSEEYQKIVARTPVPYVGDELHHSGWNACSSCHGDAAYKRDLLILPGFASGRIYAFDVFKDPRSPKLVHTVEPETIKSATGLSWPHTSHCLGTGEVVISHLGDEKGDGKGGFVVFDQKFNLKGTWGEQLTDYGYDFWYKPRHNLLISSEFGSPNAFKQGFDPSLVGTKYGSKLHVWDWDTKQLRQTLELGSDGLIPLEIRFKHDPDSADGFVGTALSSNVLHIHKSASTPKEWAADVVIRQPWTKVEGWALPEQPPLITDILISLDDHWLYFSNWIRGDINQYDISDPVHPKLTARLFTGGSIRAGSGVTVTDGEFKDAQPDVKPVKGVTLQGGPQMIQLSTDGKRLYVTNSLFSPWDKQFYPDMIKHGSQLLKIDVDNVNGGLKLDEHFLVDFGKEPGGPVLAHEVRFPGGDCSSDIWY